MISSVEKKTVQTHAEKVKFKFQIQLHVSSIIFYMDIRDCFY